MERHHGLGHSSECLASMGATSWMRSAIGGRATRRRAQRMPAPRQAAELCVSLQRTHSTSSRARRAQRQTRDTRRLRRLVALPRVRVTTSMEPRRLPLLRAHLRQCNCSEAGAAATAAAVAATRRHSSLQRQLRHEPCQPHQRRVWAATALHRRVRLLCPLRARWAMSQQRACSAPRPARVSSARRRAASCWRTCT